MSTMSTRAPLLSVRETARRLGVHENTVRRWADRGILDAVRLPTGVRRLRADEVEALGRGFDRQGATTEQAGEPGLVTSGDPADEPGLGTSGDPVGEHPAAEQRVEPISHPADLALPGFWESDAELEAFVAMVYAERDRDR